MHRDAVRQALEDNAVKVLALNEEGPHAEADTTAT